MIEVLATNITSPLGYTTEENFQAIMEGETAISTYENYQGIPEPIAAAFFTQEQTEHIHTNGFSRFESLAIHSISEALSHVAQDIITSPRTILIVSTTKANISELTGKESDQSSYLFPGEAALKIARHLGFTTHPIVVCNACISGVTAQVLAQRFMRAGHYDHAVICGLDIHSLFTISGFLSFKSLSPYPCRPFDIERLGLNIGEAAATIVLGKTDGENGKWHLYNSCLNNDAYHISAPSPNGDGVYRAIETATNGFPKEELGTICAHGTATMFNDQMESKAIERAQLSDISVSALKGYYGHTLGASGVLETIITMRSIDEGVILPTKGFEEIGVSGKIHVSNALQPTDKKAFLKIISGFGGCNGALVLSKDSRHPGTNEEVGSIAPKQNHAIRITPTSVHFDDKAIQAKQSGKQLLTELYKTYVGNYPKFYKMDSFSRLVFLASELLIQQEDSSHDGEERAIVLFNRTSSIVADRNHLATIEDKDNFFPSPSVFVYTLPNIVTGEIAIKHNYHGETSLYILDHKYQDTMDIIMQATFQNKQIKSMLTGWVDCASDDIFEAELKIITNKTTE